MIMNNITLNIIVIGRVQGVGFRWFAREQAQDMEINGYVKNLPNGNVEILAQGREEQVWKLIDRLREGPAFAQVIDLKIQEQNDTSDYINFDVLF